MISNNSERNMAKNLCVDIEKVCEIIYYMWELEELLENTLTKKEL